MGALAGPLVFPLGGDGVITTAADIWAADLVEVRFSQVVKNNALLATPTVYLITPEEAGPDPLVTGVLTGNQETTDRIFLVTAGLVNGRTYIITFAGLNTPDGALLQPYVTKFVARPTKVDAIVGSRPAMYDMNPLEPLRVILNAIGHADDQIGGCRKDQIEDFNAVTKIRVSVTPASDTVATGAQLAITVTISGTDDPRILWYVNSVYLGNSTEGTITEAGLYTAPAIIPANNPVQIIAYSLVDPSKSGICLATIV